MSHFGITVETYILILLVNLIDLNFDMFSSSPISACEMNLLLR